MSLIYFEPYLSLFFLSLPPSLPLSLSLSLSLPLPLSPSPCLSPSRVRARSLHQVSQSVEQVKAVLKQILDEGFTEEEFQGAKGPLVTKVRETEKQNVFWVQLMEDLGNDVSPKSLDCIRQVADHYDSLTKEQVCLYV